MHNLSAVVVDILLYNHIAIITARLSITGEPPPEYGLCIYTEPFAETGTALLINIISVQELNRLSF